MGFRKNLRKKILIRHLSQKVSQSIKPTDTRQHIDRSAMRQLLDIGGYSHRKERDLDLYFMTKEKILVLDNELKIYKTSAQDIALRKSPTIKEMISIRNAMKILNDKDVVITRSTETVEYLKNELIEGLNLSYGKRDIHAMTKDGIKAIENNYTEGIVDILTLFAELLHYDNAPKVLQALHYHIWGKTTQSENGELFTGPLIIFGLMDNTLKMYQKKIHPADRKNIQQFRMILKGEKDADLSGKDVLDALQQKVLALNDDKDKLR